MTTADPNMATMDVEHEENAIYTANPRKMMWLRFRKHKLALGSLYLLLFAYLVAIFAEVVAPYTPQSIEKLQTFVPPRVVRVLHEGQIIQ
ncbi:MAG: hypothetical protein P8X69_14805 [Maritimibacter sp.]